MLICAILLLPEVSWRKGKMIYIFSSRLDRKKKKAEEMKERVWHCPPKLQCQSKGCFQRSPFGLSDDGSIWGREHERWKAQRGETTCEALTAHG